MKLDWVYISDIGKHLAQEVTIKGWLHNRRSSGKIHFLIVRDGTGFIQAVMSKAAVGDEAFQRADHLSQETSLVVTGTVRADKRAKGGYEIDAQSFEVVSPSVDYPITPKEHGVDFLMDRRHLWIRSERQSAVLRVRAEVIASIRRFFDDRGFILADTPIFTPAACEGTSTLFETEYFGEKAYLSQSGQLYLEPAAAALGKVYCFGPTFRAEKSKTRRHLTEFWMVEPEVAWLRFDGLLDLCEEFLSVIVARVLDRCAADLERLERDTSKLLPTTAGSFPRLDYAEAVARLRQLGSDITLGDDLGGDDETLLTAQFDRPVAVTRYPAAIKAFYMQPDPADPSRALAVDVLAPEGYGEIIGGSERSDSLEHLERQIATHSLPREAFEWYLDVRRYGSFPHSGFGMGIERCVAWICGIPHLREAIPYPRLINRLNP